MTDDAPEAPASPDAPEPSDAAGDAGSAASPSGEPAPEPSPEDHARRAMQALEERFIFRKLGLCYDIASDPSDFPRASFPDARTVREGIPNVAGLGSGLAGCARNGGLLFDGYLLRVELGLDRCEEEKILDRLIGGLIRTATTGPKGFLARGLTPDGRGFYAVTDAESHLYWAFSIVRGFHTPAIAPESQGKMENIAAKWIGRLERDDWILASVEGEAGFYPSLLETPAPGGPLLLALLAAAATVTGSGRWNEALRERAAEAEGVRLHPDLDACAGSAADLLTLQVALYILSRAGEIESVAPIAEEARALMPAVAERATAHLEAFRRFDPDAHAPEPDHDWRAHMEKAAAPDDPAAAAAFEARLFEAWPALAHEAQTLRPAVEAGLTLLLCEDASLTEPHAPALEQLLETIPYERVRLAATLSPLLSLHGRGVEAGLWDAERATVRAPEESDYLTARKYLADEFDETHPEAAGHVEAPKKRKKREDETSSATSAEEKKGRRGGRRGRGRGRKRRRKKSS